MPTGRATTSMALPLPSLPRKKAHRLCIVERAVVLCTGLWEGSIPRGIVDRRLTLRPQLDRSFVLRRSPTRRRDRRQSEGSATLAMRSIELMLMWRILTSMTRSNTTTSTLESRSVRETQVGRCSRRHHRVGMPDDWPVAFVCEQFVQGQTQTPQRTP